MKNVSLISAISLPIDLYVGDILLGPATAFFYNKGGRTFLVSNWHVFSGRHAQTGQPLHRSGAIPDRIRMKMHADNVGDYGYGWRLPLQNDEGEPTWQQHPAGQDYDIACIQSPSLPAGLKCYTIDDYGERQLEIAIGADVMIVGFPKGLAAQGIWPIWKRGTLAAEPHVDRIDGLPIYLVDAASREGMSGSPVYLYSTGAAQTEDGAMTISSGPVAKFIGIYSGRYGDEADMQLGRVWKRELLNEMCLSPIKGSYDLRRTG